MKSHIAYVQNMKDPLDAKQTSSGKVRGDSRKRDVRQRKCLVPSKRPSEAPEGDLECLLSLFLALVSFRVKVEEMGARLWTDVSERQELGRERKKRRTLRTLRSSRREIDQREGKG
jgi:hypothetical protein